MTFCQHAGRLTVGKAGLCHVLAPSPPLEVHKAQKQCGRNCRKGVAGWRKIGSWQGLDCQASARLQRCTVGHIVGAQPDSHSCSQPPDPLTSEEDAVRSHDKGAPPDHVCGKPGARANSAATHILGAQSSTIKSKQRTQRNDNSRALTKRVSKRRLHELADSHGLTTKACGGGKGGRAPCLQPRKCWNPAAEAAAGQVAQRLI